MKLSLDKAFDFFVLYSILILLIRAIAIYNSGMGFENRGMFFSDDGFGGNVFEMVYAEIVSPLFILYTLIKKFRWSIFILVIASSFLFYTRAGLYLYVFALMLSDWATKKQKIYITIICLTSSFFLLYIRFGENILENLSEMFLTYPFIGMGRLLSQIQISDINIYQVISILIKPIDLILFPIDWIGGYNGSLSGSRMAGFELREFRHIPLLDSDYNAFGTILFPFIYFFGNIGYLIFIFFIIFQYIVYRVILGNNTASSVMVYLLVTGTLYSWLSPFVWTLPFLFAKKKEKHVQY